MQRLHIDGWRGRVRSRLRPQHPGRPLQELSLPGRDLVGMNVKLLRQLSQRLLAPYGSQGHLRFESRRVVPAGSSAHRLSCSAAILAAVRQRLHLSNLFKNPEPALSSTVSKVRTQSRFSLRVRIKRSAQPFPSGARTKAGELSMPRKASSCWNALDMYWLP